MARTKEPNYFFLLACANALAAAVFDAVLLRPSRNTCEAALAALEEVVSRGALLWVKALPAAVLAALPDEGLSNTLAAALAAFGLVPFFIAFLSSKLR